jgi:predicted transcriptional regulator
MYKWQQVTLLKEQGLSIKKIARKMHISKNTVRKYLRNPDPPAFKLRHYEKMVDGYREKIQVMINKGYIGTRIFNELMSMGYIRVPFQHCIDM